VDRQQDPPSVHLTVNAHNAPVTDEYLADLAAAVDHVLAHPELSGEGEAAMYGMMAKVPVKGLVRRGVRQVLEQVHSPEGMTGPPQEAMGGDGLLDRLVDRYGERIIAAVDRFRR
jgi:hypothetical protein